MTLNIELNIVQDRPELFDSEGVQMNIKCQWKVYIWKHNKKKWKPETFSIHIDSKSTENNSKLGNYMYGRALGTFID